jgi:MFS family permease
MSEIRNSRAAEENSLQYAGWGVLTAAFVGVMVSFAPIVPYTFSLFLNPLHAAFGWRREAIGGTFALAAITVALVSPFIGMLLDRFPPRRIILPAIVVFSLALASLNRLGPNIFQFYIIYFVLGLVANGTAQFAYAYDLDMVSEKQRLRAGATPDWQRRRLHSDSTHHPMVH